MTIYAGAINRDHAHMLVSIPPQYESRVEHQGAGDDRSLDIFVE